MAPKTYNLVHLSCPKDQEAAVSVLQKYGHVFHDEGIAGTYIPDYMLPDLELDANYFLGDTGWTLKVEQR